jgi:hypothetical protein
MQWQESSASADETSYWATILLASVLDTRVRRFGDRQSTGRVHDWRKIAISNNVGSVKQFSSALQHALEEERHFALVDGLRVSNLGSFLIVRVKNSVRPSHLFDHQMRP